MPAILNKDDVTKTAAETARMICAEQPDVAEPESIRDLDSFSLVQIVLELENIYSLRLMEVLEEFQGEEFEDLAETIIEVAAKTGEEKPEDS